MKFNDYQEATNETAVTSGPENDVTIERCVLGMAGESGEVCEKVKKFLREDDPEYLDDLEDEIGDVLWYIAQLCEQLDLEMNTVAERNVEKLADRKDRGKLTGEGDNR